MKRYSMTAAAITVAFLLSSGVSAEAALTVSGAHGRGIGEEDPDWIDETQFEDEWVDADDSGQDWFADDTTVAEPQEAAAADDPAAQGSAAELPKESEPVRTQDLIASHVSGLLDFSVIQGMQPDVMTGVSWDETIETVEPDLTGVDWNLVGTQILKYNITSTDGRRAIATLKVTVWPDLDFFLYGMEGELIVDVGDDLNPMEGITWGTEISTVTADASEVDLDHPGRYLIAYNLLTEDGRSQSTVRQITVSDGTYTEGSGFTGQAEETYASVYDLGLWRLTAYMDTPADQGIYVGKTASGAPLIAGRTVAVSAATCSRLGLQFGDRLMIDGHIYILEDHGGPAMHNQNWVDIFVDNPYDEYSERFNRYSEVYLLR